MIDVAYLVISPLIGNNCIASGFTFSSYHIPNHYFPLIALCWTNHQSVTLLALDNLQSLFVPMAIHSVPPGHCPLDAEGTLYTFRGCAMTIVNRSCRCKSSTGLTIYEGQNSIRLRDIHQG